MSLQNPLFQPLLIIVQGQIPVFGFLEHRLRTADGTCGVDEFGGVEGRTAFLTLVAVGLGIVAVGTFSDDVAVGQELLGFLVIILLGGFLYQFAFFIHFLEEVGSHLAVGGRCGAAVDIKRDAKVGKALFNHLMIAVNHLLWGDALFLGTDGDGHAMLIAAANKLHILFLQS